MAADIRIVRQHQVSALSAAGTLETRVRIEFNVGTDGPFLIELPQAEFSADRALAEMEIIAGEVRKLRGGVSSGLP